MGCPYDSACGAGGFLDPETGIETPLQARNSADSLGISGGRLRAAPRAMGGIQGRDFVEVESGPVDGARETWGRQTSGTSQTEEGRRWPRFLNLSVRFVPQAGRPIVLLRRASRFALVRERRMFHAPPLVSAGSNDGRSACRPGPAPQGRSPEGGDRLARPGREWRSAGAGRRGLRGQGGVTSRTTMAARRRSASVISSRRRSRRASGVAGRSLFAVTVHFRPNHSTR